jgi:hypothetical protein
MHHKCVLLAGARTGVCVRGGGVGGCWGGGHAAGTLKSE